MTMALEQAKAAQELVAVAKNEERDRCASYVLLLSERPQTPPEARKALREASRGLRGPS